MKLFQKDSLMPKYKHIFKIFNVHKFSLKHLLFVICMCFGGIVSDVSEHKIISAIQ